MEEQLISFETAKLAKEKGFYTGTHNIYEWQESYEMVPQSLLQKWLREKKLFALHVSYNYCKEVKGKYGTLPESFYQCTLVDIRKNEVIFDVVGFGSKTYEEALEHGLQEALKLI